MNKYARSAITTVQAVFIVALVVVVAGGGYWWYSSTIQQEQQPSPLPLELPRLSINYSRFGFSLKYPEGMAFSEGVFTGGFDHVRPLSGDIQGTEDQIPEVMGVIRLHADSRPNLDLFLDELFASVVEIGDFRDLSRGPLETFKKDEHEMVYQTFSLTDTDGISQTGIVGSWYVEEELRIYSLYTATLPDVANQIDLDARFQQYLNSFDSEGWIAPSGEIESYWPSEGWRYALPEDVGIDSAKLDEMMDYIKVQGIGVDSVMVIRDGYVAMDSYFPPFDEGELHDIYSCTKSVTSTLIGFAIEEGYIESLDQRLLDFFPDRTVKNMNAWKEEITLRDLLTMSAGFELRGRDVLKMIDSPDALQYVLDLEVIREPGTQFEYIDGISHLLSCILSETTGMNALEYARERFFTPLGIEEVEWESDSLERTWGWGTLHLTPHDMAKIGYLFLNEGRWEGEQIVSEEWVKEATKKHLDIRPLAPRALPGYGYQWWVSSNGYYTALGGGGQFIHVVPDLDLVMVTTGSNHDDFNRILSLLETYVIPAVTD